MESEKAMKQPHIEFIRKADQVLIRLENGEEKPVKLVWVRPVTGRGQEISAIGMDKAEVMMLASIDELDPSSKRIAEEELTRRYLVPDITKVNRAEANFGNRYQHVETDHGPRSFLMKDPAANIIWVTDDNLVIRDTLGNRYQVKSFSALDAQSRALMENVI